MKRCISAALVAAMLFAAGAVPAAAAGETTMAAYFEDFESGSVGQLQTSNNAAELSVADYKYSDGTTGKVLKAVSNGSTQNAAVMYDPADKLIGKDGVRIVFDFSMTDVPTDDAKRVDAAGAKVSGLLWSENKAVHSNGSGYWFTDKNLWKFDRDAQHFGGSGNIGVATDKWWKLVQDYDFKNKKYTAVIFNTSSGDIYGSFSRDLTALESTDKFDRAAIVLPVKGSVTYIDNFRCEPLNRLNVDFGSADNVIEKGSGSVTVSALNGWVTAVSVDGNSKKLANAKNERAKVDLSALSGGKHKLTVSVSYNDNTTETTETAFEVISDSFEIVSPQSGGTDSAPSFTVNAPGGFYALEFVLDGKIIRTFRNTDTSNVYSADAEVAYGSHTLEAIMTEQNGNCKRKSVDFELNINGSNPIKMLTYVKDGIESGYAEEVPSDAQKLKLYLNTGLRESSVGTNTVSVYSNGKKLALSGVVYNGDEKSVAAELNEPLPQGSGELKINGALLESGADTEYAIIGKFEAIDDCVYIKRAQLLCNGNEIYSKYQINDGDNVSVTADILNPTNQRRTAILAAAVYDSGKLADIAVQQAAIAPMHISNVHIEDNMNISEDSDVKVMLLDSLYSMRPLGNKAVPGTSVSGKMTKETLTEYDFETDRDYRKYPKENTISEKSEENGNTYAEYERTANTNDCFTDITLPSNTSDKLAAADSYVVECDIRIDELNGGIDVITYKSTAGAWGSPLLTIGGDGGIRLAGSVIGKAETGGKWTRLSLLYNNETSKVSCFKNGICLAEGIAFDPSLIPALYRTGVQSKGGNVIFGMDNFRIYEADKPKNYVAKKDGTFESVMEDAVQATQTVGKNDFVLMVSNGAYLSGGVKKTSKYLPYTENGTVMMPADLCEESFDCIVSQSGSTVSLGSNVKTVIGSTSMTVGGKSCTLSQPPAEKNGVVYIPLKDIAENGFDKYYYWDDRGFAVISDAEFTLRNSDAVQLLNEPIDILYRYLQFERPSGKQLVSAIIKKHPNNGHPRILAASDDIAEMKKNISANAAMKTWADNVVSDADKYAQTAGQLKPPSSGGSILTMSKEAVERVRSYAGAYFITDDEKYAQYAWTELDNICSSFSAWNDTSHFLDAAEMAYAFAIGYDSFYDLFTETQKKQLRDTVVKNALKRGLVAYEGTHPNGYWINGDDNWTAVCPGGLMSAAIAIADEDDSREVCENILGCTVQSFEYVMSLLYPDGGWYESLGYFDYTMEYIYAGIGSLINATGSDWGLLNVPGAERSCEYTLAMHGLDGGCFNYHDGNGSKWGSMITGPEMLWFAKELGQTWYGKKYVEMQNTLEKNLSKSQVPKLDIIALLNYNPNDTDEYEMPLDDYFRQTEGGTMRQNWSENAAFVGVHAGRNGVDHDHLDLGEFVFDSDGVRWVNDFGGDDYSLPNYFEEAGYNIYLKRPEANNCFVINPREDFPGQRTSCAAKLLKRESADDHAFMSFDLSEAYADDASSAIRGFMLGDNRRTLLIRDEIELKKESEIDWFMNLNAWPVGNQPAYTVENNTITFRNGTKTLKLELETNADSYEFIMMNREPLFSSTVMGKVANETKNYPKLRIKLNGSGKLYAAVKLIPGSAEDAASVSNLPISEW